MKGLMIMTNPKFITPVITAFDENGNLDTQSNLHIYDFLIDAGIDGLLIMGSAGEFYALTHEEKKQLIDLSITHIHGRVKTLYGTGCMTVEESIELSQYAVEKGAKDIILMSPYYFGLSEDILYDYFGKIAQSVNCNVYLYNFPARTGYDLSPELTLKLIQDFPNIVGYKDTVSDMAHTRKLIRAVTPKYPNFEIYSGFDENYTRNVLSDGNGGIGALSNLYPELFVKLVKATNSKNWDEINQIQVIIDQLMSLYDITPCFIPIIKKAMILRGIDLQGYCKSPISPATPAQTDQIKQILNTVDMSNILAEETVN
jgi:4-hydroxy-tetrahydrodipicolinate synthase